MFSCGGAVRGLLPRATRIGQGRPDSAAPHPRAGNRRTVLGQMVGAYSAEEGISKKDPSGVKLDKAIEAFKKEIRRTVRA